MIGSKTVITRIHRFTLNRYERFLNNGETGLALAALKANKANTGSVLLTNEEYDYLAKVDDKDNPTPIEDALEFVTYMFGSVGGYHLGPSNFPTTSKG